MKMIIFGNFAEIFSNFFASGESRLACHSSGQVGGKRDGPERDPREREDSRPEDSRGLSKA